MKQNFKRFLSLVLAIMMVFSMFTGNVAYAADEGDPIAPLDTEGVTPDAGTDTQEPQDEVDDDAHKHNYVAMTTYATCVVDGVITYTCECNDRYTEAIPAPGHTYEEGVCSVCGEAEDVAEEVENVAKIGEQGYETLSAAITAAAAGNTITLIADVNENVTISKNLTIDGGNFNYTGKMAISEGKTVTVQNVNFIKGYIDTTKSSKNKLTVVNCDFVGDATINYAITVRGGSSVVVENSTAKDYGYGMLYVPNSVASITVKNVDVENAAAAFNISYSNDGIFENVTLNNVTYGLHVQNHAARTFTLKNCEFTARYPIYIQEKGSAKVTFRFEGDNKFDSDIRNYTLSDYAISVMGEGATLELVMDFAAELNGEKYITLQAAINAATAGKTITLLANVEEDVTVNKSLTIDGANFTYTGIMNVTANVTIKNVNFDGKGMNTYAVETRGANNITIEDCTAKNYGYGLLQVVKGNTSTVVKNVTITDVNYGVKIDRSSRVTIENVTMQNVRYYGIYDSNYTAKTYTIKNCEFNTAGASINIWERNTTVTDTFVFEGKNQMSSLEMSANAKYVLTKDATLTAPEGLGITTNVADYKVAYANGVYSVVENVCVAELNGVEYESLQAAVDACIAGDNAITLLADIDETVTIKQTAGINITIDGAGKTYSGTIKVDGNNRPNGAETLTIQDVNFKDTNATAYSYFIDAMKNAKGGNSEVHNLTVDSCTFESNNWHYAIATRHPNNLVVKNCSADKVYYFIYNPQGGQKMAIEDCVATNATYGIGANKCREVLVKNFTYTGKGAGFNGRAYEYSCVATLENVNITTTLNGQPAVALWKNDDNHDCDPYTFNFVGTNVLKTPEGTASFARQSETNSPYVLQLGNVNATLEATEGLSVTLPGTNEFADFKVTYENGIYFVGENDYVAELNGVKYETLQAAVDACVAGDNVITLLADIDETVTIKQTAGVNITIDGTGKTYSGTISVNGNKRSTGTETLTIQNVNFVAQSDAQIFITAVENTYVHNLTVDGCTFTGTDAMKAYGLALRHAYNVAVKNTTASKLYALVYAPKAVTGFTAENVTITDAIVGFGLLYGKNLGFKNVTLDVSGTGVLINNYNASSATFEGCTFTAGTPIVLEQKNTSRNYTLTFNGTNNFTAENGVVLNVVGTDASFKVEDNDETLALTKDNTNGLYAKVGEDGNVFYNRVQDAINAADAESVIYVIDDAAQNISVTKNLGLEAGENELLGTIAVADGAALTIYSGTFNDHSAKDYVVEGMVAMDIEDGKWTVTDPITAGFVARNIATGEYFEYVTDAMDVAKDGETVILLVDCEENTVFVDYGATLDLNGYTLTAKRVATFAGHVIDSSEANSGVLNVERKHYIPAVDNKQLPVWTENGYQFVEITKYNAQMTTGGKFVFQVKFEPYAHELLLNDGEFNVDSGVSIYVRAEWTHAHLDDDGNVDYTEPRKQDLVYGKDMVSRVLNSYDLATNKYGQMFTLTLDVPEGIDDLTYSALVQSSIGTEHLSAPVEHN